MKRDVDINHNLETDQLQILTNTQPGKHESVVLYFINVGKLSIEFLHKRFWVQNCGTPAFPSSLPAEGDRQWTISKTKDALTILCNGIEVLNLVYTDSTDSSCSNVWTKESTSFKFLSNDFASDYYRNPSGQGNGGVSTSKHAFITRLSAAHDVLYKC